jgi:hypothetical protein
MCLLRRIWAVVHALFAKKADLSVPVPHGAEGEMAGEEIMGGSTGSSG